MANIRKLTADQRALRDFALSLPGAYEDFPWGDRVAKVGKKVFAFLGHDGKAAGVNLAVKLPHSAAEALALPFAKPTGYGLGRHGWVSVYFEPGEQALVKLLKEWIVESYRAVAPKRMAAELDAREATGGRSKAESRWENGSCRS